MSEVATVPNRREATQVIDAVPILDTARFEHMQRIANIMARSTMVPETLCMVGKRDDKEPLPFEQVLSNCFLVVNQAARWGMDPFAVISCCAVVHGRLAYEGKLVAAVLDAKLGLQLHHYFTGSPTTEDYRIYLSDQPFTEEIIAKLRPGIVLPGPSLWDGSVGEWKTTGSGTPWSVKNYRRMLIYRGTRDWARIYKSALMLGVYTDDELLDLVDDARARRAAPVLSISERLAAGNAAPGSAPDGFSPAHVARELGDDAKPSTQSETEAQREAGDLENPPASKGDEPEASDQGAAPAGPGPTDTPHSEPQSGQPIQESSGVSPAGDGVQAGEGAPPLALVGLPSDWPKQYADALKNAKRKSDLTPTAKKFWTGIEGGFTGLTDADRDTAIAIFDVFGDNFGKPEARDAALSELEAV